MRFRDYIRKACNNILPHFVLRGINILVNEGLYTFIYKIREYTRSGKIYEKWIIEKEKKENETIFENPKQMLTFVRSIIY